MKHYIITGRVFEIPANVKVELTPEQYACRKHALKPVDRLFEKWDKAVFETVQKIEFKQGEQIGTELEVGKAQMVQVIPVQLGSDSAITDAARKKADEIAAVKKK